MLEEFDQLFDPLFGVVREGLARVTELRGVRVKHIGGKEGAEVGNSLLIGGHIPLGESSEHLVRVQLLMELPLKRRLVIILGE